jgi:hypothetical protein
MRIVVTILHDGNRAMTDSDKPTNPTEPGSRRLARVVLLVFLLTFILTRVLVFLIMARVLPDLFVHLGGTHVHHLNYGIVLLCATGAWLLFAPPQGHPRTLCAVLYAIGLALTFDEFGMWLHLGGGYWQRASFDAVTVIAAVLALLSYAPARGSWTRRHVVGAVIVTIAVALFGVLLAHSLSVHQVGPRLQQLERGGPK